MSEQRAFRGVWIPAEIWLNRDLTLQEKVMLIEIESLQHPQRGCFKSNKKIAEFFGLSTSRVSEVISSLSKKGWVRIEQVREGKQIVERRIFIDECHRSNLLKNDEGYSGNASNPIRHPEEGYSGNAEERGSGLGVQKENNNPMPTPDGERAEEPAKIPSCPHSEIIDAWAEVMSDKRQPAKSLWQGTARERHLADRWKQLFNKMNEANDKPFYTDKASGIEWWTRFFRYLRKSEFLMNNERNFFELAWVIKKENFVKILERKYHQEQGQ